MPEYRLPTWNIRIGVWHPGITFVPLFAPIQVNGQLRAMSVAGVGGFSPSSASHNFQGTPCFIAVPRGTDIRRRSTTTPDSDWLWNTRLEVIGTNRLYAVINFEDVAAGFENEYRRCVCVRMPPDAVPLPPVVGVAFPAIPDDA